MPHVIVKLVAGRTDQQKTALAEAITKAVMGGVNVTEDAVSVSFEDVASADWVEAVYRPDILAKPATLFKKPGYDPLR